MPPSSRPIPKPSLLHEEPTAVLPAPVAGPVTEPEKPAPALAASDRCTNCGSSLAADQHYCLVCGERRGKARFSSPTPGATTGLVTEERASPRPPRSSGAATLIAGVATLLIAMGIGVYIGGLGKNSNGSGNSPVRVVTVNGGGSGAPTASTAPTAASAGGSSGGAGKGKGKGHGSHKGASAAKVVTTVKNLPPPTVTVGAHGSGKGYQGGKFTGHFFGP